MRLPAIQLDDRRFQDLVSEARLRIHRACPEWTEHNVSDPGITLIELFAWMTEMTIYRLNRVPDKLHVALLDLLGIRLDGPAAATTSLRFRLADAPTEPILIGGGSTEVGTPRTAQDESVIFQVDEDFTIPVLRPAAYVVQRANQAKDDFLAKLSHELRTPLNGMSGWLWHLRQPEVSDAIRARALDGLDRNVKVQKQLINELLDVSRIERGKIELDRTSVDLRALLQESIEAVRSDAVAKSLAVDLTASPATVHGDYSRLRQISDNLLNNAVQFTAPGGRIAVSLSVSEGTAVVQIRDNGLGIEPAFLPHVFESFRQAPNSPDGHGGLGLGLAIAKQLALLHGGTIAAESEGVGHGATFTVRLPVSSPDQAKAGAPADVSHTLDGIRLLVVEDHFDSRQLLQAMLRSAGATVKGASSASAALALLKEQSFDAMVSDIGLPDMDGLSLLQTARNVGYKLPAVAVTAYTSERDRERIRTAGYVAHVGKPVDYDELIRFVRDVCRR